MNIVRRFWYLIPPIINYTVIFTVLAQSLIVGIGYSLLGFVNVFLAFRLYRRIKDRRSERVVAILWGITTAVYYVVLNLMAKYLFLKGGSPLMNIITQVVFLMVILGGGFIGFIIVGFCYVKISRMLSRRDVTISVVKLKN